MAATRTPAAEAGFAHVVILASLGGLPAISVLLSELPATFPVPVLLLQHAPNNGSPHRLASLLGKRTALPVRTAQSASSARAPGVTVIPGGHTATVSPQGFLHLREAAGPAGDALLTSAATAATPDKVIAVVLSGMLHDGTEGVRATKRHGGRVLAQDPATARAPGNAIKRHRHRLRRLRPVTRTNRLCPHRTDHGAGRCRTVLRPHAPLGPDRRLSLRRRCRLAAVCRELALGPGSTAHQSLLSHRPLLPPAAA